jgi:CBS-domain-containing membrane protein
MQVKGDAVPAVINWFEQLMEAAMKAKDVMARNVVTVDRDATILQAARMMLQHHISGLPVVDASGKLVGILSEGDFLRRQETGTQRRRSRCRRAILPFAISCWPSCKSRTGRRSR